MSTGLYQDHFVAERFVASPTAQTVGQRYVVPADADVLGLILWLGTAPGANSGVIANVNNLSTSQQGGLGTPVGAYNLWTAANAPSVLGANTTNLTVVQTPLVTNVPYALNYPLPGPAGTSGYITAQTNVLTVENPVLAPPTSYKVGVNPLYGSVAPDAVFTDYNGVTGSPASYVRAGDVLSFVLTAGGSGVSIGAAANLNIELVLCKR